MKAEQNRSKAVFFLNGERHEVDGPAAGMMFADYLRYQTHLTGTKIVCAEGDCGACSILRIFVGAGQKPKYYQAINSCIMTVAQMDGSSLVTVEYLGKEKADAVQEHMVNAHGSQCGFCTPGFVMAIRGLFEKERREITLQKAKNALTGNLCRCTGYKQILDAVLSASRDKIRPLFEEAWHADMEKSLRTAAKKPLLIQSGPFEFYAPTTIKHAAAYLAKNKDAKIVAAGTDLGVQVNKGKNSYQHVLSLHLIADLYAIKIKGSRVTVGARVTLESLRIGLKDSIPTLSSYLDIFASPQIKHVATLVGNLCNASPIGDTLPFLLAMNAVVYVVGKSTRKIPIENYFLGYRSTALKKGELVTAVEFDIPMKGDSIYLYKTSQRKDLDISAVNGAIRLGKEVRVALGGLAPIPCRLLSVEKLLEKGLKDEALQKMQEEIKPISDVRGSGAFRRLLAKNFLKDSLEQEIHRSHE